MLKANANLKTIKSENLQTQLTAKGNHPKVNHWMRENFFVYLNLDCKFFGD